ncbi:MAG: Hsp20/alpha crystallin family protein [Actinomycetota bacterium]
MALPVRRRDSDQPVAWEPWRELEDLYDRMGRLVRDSFADLAPIGRWSPPLDLEETEDAYVAELDLPGVRRDDVQVEVVGNQVRVHGEVKERQRSGVLRRQTRRLGVFDYTFTVPGEVDPDRIEASLADGVLSIRAPKAEAAKPRRIEITAG